MAKKTATAAANAAPTPAAPAANAKPEVKKIPKAMADQMLSAGFLSKEKYEEMTKAGLITSGGGGGSPVADQLIQAGVPEELVKRLEEALERVNAVLWDGKKYAGRYIRHKDKKGTERDVALEAAIWVKHYADEKKDESE